MQEKLMILNIYSVAWQVEYSNLDNGAVGSTHYDKRVIYLDAREHIENQKITLIHEILHICIRARWPYQIEAASKVNDLDLMEHLLIDPISSCLYDVLRDNPHLKDWLYT